MEKLKLNGIVPYLLYELRFMSGNEEYILTDLRIARQYPIWACSEYNEDSHSYEPTLNKKNNNIGKGFNLWEIKPILHPLSDLTQEIEHNGERFVPIVELYRLSNEYYYTDNLDYEFIDSWGAKGNILKVFHDRKKDEYTEFVYGNGSFRKDRRYNAGSYVFGMNLPHSIRCDQKIHNEYKLFEKLLEWHFWIFDQSAFDKGLIIKKE